MGREQAYAEKAGHVDTSPTQPRRSAARRLLSFEHALATDNLTSLIQAETPRSQLAGVAIVLKIASHISPF
jgi:hypothetical protein